MTVRIRPLTLVLVTVAASIPGCYGASKTRVEGETPDERRSSTQVNWKLDADEARIDRGRDAASRGDYAAALDLYDSVYRNPSAKPDLRALALYQTALVQSNVLNPGRDNAQAVASARKLVAEFPDSEWRDEAQELVGRLENVPRPGP